MKNSTALILLLISVGLFYVVVSPQYGKVQVLQAQSTQYKEILANVEEVTQGLDGVSRPGHFRGVATVVTKLLALFRPDVALFGEKDYQQLQVIRRMVRDLHMPIEIVGVPTERDSDGLELASRNQFLSAAERMAEP